MSAKTRPEAELKRFIDGQLRSGVFTHAYFETGFLAQAEPVFAHSWLPDGRSLFDLASLTKAVVTTSVFFWLLDNGNVSLDAPLRDWLPRDTKLKGALLNLSARTLLGHTSGLPAWRNFYVNRLQPDTPLARYSIDAPAHVEAVLAREDVTVGAKKDLYSDVGFILLGYAMEKATTRNLNQLFNDFRIHEGLDSKQDAPLLFTPNDEQRQHCISTGTCPVRARHLLGEVHDENCAALGGVAGHAGLFGAGGALSQFLKGFFPTKTGQRVFAENTKMMTDKKDSTLCGYRYGNDETTAAFCGGKTMGHYGFSGTAFWIEPTSGKYVIFLTNRVAAGRLNPNFRAVRKQVFTFADEIVAFA